ncbi:hypothetical protein LSPH26S_00282 [Lysinibacillus sphaericus]
MQLLERAMTIAKVLASEASEGSLSISELSTKCDLPCSIKYSAPRSAPINRISCCLLYASKEHSSSLDRLHKRQQ